MTTFLHSAAMSLLRRTLQSVLSKYIVDVDVEGVALPSLLSTLSAGSSPSSASGDPSTFSGNGGEAGWGVRLSNLHLQDGVQLMVLPGKTRKPTESKEKAPRDRKHRRKRSSPPSPKQPFSATVEQSEAIVTEEENRFTAEQPAINEPPPVAPKKGWFSGWFTSSTATASHSLESMEDVSLLTNPSHDNLLEAACLPPSQDVQSVNGECINLAEDSNDHRDYDDEGSMTSFAEDDDESNQVESPEQPPMVLKLGKDGTIGILDVRLVGKTIHVMLEDADLTIEMVRQSPNSAPPASWNKKGSGPETSPPNLKTTGDRVLKENILARYLSMIPNLFLRDIRIRLIIRDEAEDDAPAMNESDTRMSQEERNDSVEEDGRAGFGKYNRNDTVIELTIDLFSVNNGKDFLLNFGGEVDSDETSSSSSSFSDNVHSGCSGEGVVAAPVSGSNVSLGAMDNLTSNNEFLTKRIRTGRGPEGGIVLKIYQAGESCRSDTPVTEIGHADAPKLWARESWNNSTNDVFLRCSGLDLQAQIFLGTKKEIAISRHGYYEGDLPYNDFSVDAMLFGVDYIVPGPQPPLPSLSNVQGLSPLDKESWVISGVKFVEDSNGIQSCLIPSPFHKVARGLVPRHCSGSHLPSEWCHFCWAKDGGSAHPHALDAATPLGGLVLHIAIRDPLEINVDRYVLTVLGTLIDVFRKPNDKNSSSISKAVRDANESIPVMIPSNSQHSMASSASVHTSVGTAFPSMDDSRRSGLHRRRSSRSLSDGTSMTKIFSDFPVESAFPTYMKPEKIQMIGIHLSELRFRVHVLRENYGLEGGRSFCYWDVHGKCITLDYQNLSASERPFQDFRFDVGHLVVDCMKGVVRKRIVSLGVEPRIADFDDITIDTFRSTDSKHRRSSWPTTAAAIMDIMPTLESLVYADREHHGLQCRFLSVIDPSESLDRIRKDVNVRVGAGYVNTEFVIKNEIICVIREVSLSLLGPPKHFTAENDTLKSMDSVMKYKVTADGGTVILYPLISANLPRTVAQGEISLNAGFSIEAVLQNCTVSYGRSSPIRALDEGLSLEQLAALPDFVRLRVLLFLKDLTPLETALGLPISNNSFLRCRAVNIGIVNAAAGRNSPQNENALTSRRQALLSELLELDDDSLEELLASHLQPGNSKRTSFSLQR